MNLFFLSFLEQVIHQKTSDEPDNALQMDLFSLRRIIAANVFFFSLKSKSDTSSPWFITARISMNIGLL